MRIDYDTDKRPGTLTTTMDIVVFCENQLGWLPNYDSSTPVWKQRQAQASRLKRLMAKHDFTLEQLANAARWAARTGYPVPSPGWLYGAVEKSAQHMGEAPRGPSDMSVAVEDAVSVEITRNDAASEAWISMLLRSRGHGRRETYAMWQKERG